MSNFKIHNPDKHIIWSNKPALIPFVIPSSEIKQKYNIERADNPEKWELYRNAELYDYKKALMQTLPLVNGKDIIAMSLIGIKYSDKKPIFRYKFLNTTDTGAVFKQNSHISENITYGIDRYNNIVLEEEHGDAIKRTVFRVLKFGLPNSTENNFKTRLQNDDISSYDISQCTHAMGIYIKMT